MASVSQSTGFAIELGAFRPLAAGAWANFGHSKAVPAGPAAVFEMDDRGGLVREFEARHLSPIPETASDEGSFTLNAMSAKGPAARFFDRYRKDARLSERERALILQAPEDGVRPLLADESFPLALRSLTAGEVRAVLQDPKFQDSRILKLLTDEFGLAKAYQGDPDEYYLKKTVLALLEEEHTRVLADQVAQIEAARKDGRFTKKEARALRALAEEGLRKAYEERVKAVDQPSESLASAVMKSLMVPYGLVKPFVSGPLFVGGAYLLSSFVPGFHAAGGVFPEGGLAQNALESLGLSASWLYAPASSAISSVWDMVMPDAYTLAVQGALSTVAVGMLVGGLRDTFKNSSWLMGALDLASPGRLLSGFSPVASRLKAFIAARQPKFEIPPGADPWLRSVASAYKYAYLTIHHGFVATEQAVRRASEQRSRENARLGVPDTERLERLQKIKAALIAREKTPLVGSFLKSMGTILPGTKGELNAFNVSLFGLNMTAVVLMSGVAVPLTEALRYGVEHFLFNDPDAAFSLTASAIAKQALKSMAIGVVAWTPGCLANQYINKYFSLRYPSDPDRASQEAGLFRQKFTLAVYSIIVGSEIAAIDPGWQLAINMGGGVAALYGVTRYLRMPEGTDALPVAPVQPERTVSAAVPSTETPPVVNPSAEAVPADSGASIVETKLKSESTPEAAVSAESSLPPQNGGARFTPKAAWYNP